MDGIRSADAPAMPKQDGNNARVFALAFAGLALVCVAIGSYYVYQQVVLQPSIGDSLKAGSPESRREDDILLVRVALLVLERFFPLLLIAFFALSFTRAAISFVKASEYSRTGVVPPRDLPIIEEAIKTGRPEPVDQYIRLASLTGGVGLFQKVGLTGLPLTTLALVMFFAVGVLVSDDKNQTFAAFLDFTKLTLGAFIGSFVQRQVERRGQESEIQRAIQTVAQGATVPPGQQPKP